MRSAIPSYRLIALCLAAIALVAGIVAPGAVAQCPPILCPPDPDPDPDPEPPPPPPPPPSPTPPGVDPRGVDPRSPNPLEGLSFFVDHDQPAWKQWRFERGRGRRYREGLMWKLAREPKFRWFGKFSRPDPGAKVRDYIERAERAGQVPLMTILRHQGRRCGNGYTGGGAREDARHRAWLRRVAAAIGNSRVVIAYEPDSLGTLDCLVGRRRGPRLRTLRYGIDLLSQLPHATIYIEGGASDWESARRTARLLRIVGVHKVRGFMLNVTHYDWTSRNLRHGRRISRLTGGKHFIVSTSFNGRGPVRYRRYHARHKWKTINVWCHPLKRGLGPAPTTKTHSSKADAYMWIGRPGFSGGSCNGGPLPVGSWWPKRARMFAKYATNWIRPPRGTRYGHRKRHSLRAMAGDQLRR